MWEIDHVLVKHGVRVTQNEGIMLFVRRVFIFIVRFTARGCKKHSIKLYIARPYPSMLAIERLCKYLTHLLWLAKDSSETEIAIGSASLVARAHWSH